MSDSCPFRRLITEIPPDLRQQALDEAIGDNAPGDAATLLVFDLLRERLQVAGQVEDVGAANKIVALLLLLSGELARHPEGDTAALHLELRTILQTLESAPAAAHPTILRALAGGYEV